MGFIEDLDDVKAEIPVPDVLIAKIRAENPGLNLDEAILTADCRSYIAKVIASAGHIFNLSHPEVLSGFARARIELQDPSNVETMDVRSLLSDMAAVRLLALAASMEKENKEPGNDGRDGSNVD